MADSSAQQSYVGVRDISGSHEGIAHSKDRAVPSTLDSDADLEHEKQFVLLRMDV